MSTISSVSSTTNPYQTADQTADQNGFAQIIKDFHSIGSALQSGNVTAAQTALSAFQQDLQGNSQTSASQPFAKNSQANTDYQSLVGALQSGNLSSAQQAFASLQTDLKAGQTSSKTAHRGHHHHHRSGGGSADSLLNSLTTGSTTTSTNSTSATSPNTSTNSTAASAPTASTNGITMSFTADIEVVQVDITLNVTA
jgi:DNA-binding FadR family transcriptional regulator